MILLSSSPKIDWSLTFRSDNFRFFLSDLLAGPGVTVELTKAQTVWKQDKGDAEWEAGEVKREPRRAESPVLFTLYVCVIIIIIIMGAIAALSQVAVLSSSVFLKSGVGVQTCSMLLPITPFFFFVVHSSRVCTCVYV